MEYGINSIAVNLGSVCRIDLDKMLENQSSDLLDDEEWEVIADNVLGRTNNFLEEILEDEIHWFIKHRAEARGDR